MLVAIYAGSLSVSAVFSYGRLGIHFSLKSVNRASVSSMCYRDGLLYRRTLKCQWYQFELPCNMQEHGTSSGASGLFSARERTFNFSFFLLSRPPTQIIASRMPPRNDETDNSDEVVEKNLLAFKTIVTRALQLPMMRR